MGLSSRATGELAAESLALKTMNKKFFRTLPKELSRSRFRTARGIKNIQLKTKVPKLKVFKAKSKAALSPKRPTSLAVALVKPIPPAAPSVTY